MFSLYYFFSMKKLIFFWFFVVSLSFAASAQEGLHHLVLFKLKPGIRKEDLRVMQAVELLKELKNKIPAIIDMRAGENISGRPVAVDFGLMVMVANEKSLQNYLDHPAHKAVTDAWKEIADWTIADFWSSSGKVYE